MRKYGKINNKIQRKYALITCFQNGNNVNNYGSDNYSDNSNYQNINVYPQKHNNVEEAIICQIC